MQGRHGGRLEGVADEDPAAQDETRCQARTHSQHQACRLGDTPAEGRALTANKDQHRRAQKDETHGGLAAPPSAALLE